MKRGSSTENSYIFFSLLIIVLFVFAYNLSLSDLKSNVVGRADCGADINRQCTDIPAYTVTSSNCYHSCSSGCFGVTSSICDLTVRNPTYCLKNDKCYKDVQCTASGYSQSATAVDCPPSKKITAADISSGNYHGALAGMDLNGGYCANTLESTPCDSTGKCHYSLFSPPKTCAVYASGTTLNYAGTASCASGGWGACQYTTMPCGNNINECGAGITEGGVTWKCHLSNDGSYQWHTTAQLLALGETNCGDGHDNDCDGTILTTGGSCLTCASQTQALCTDAAHTASCDWCGSTGTPSTPECKTTAPRLYCANCAGTGNCVAKGSCTYACTQGKCLVPTSCPAGETFISDLAICACKPITDANTPCLACPQGCKSDGTACIDDCQSLYNKLQPAGTTKLCKDSGYDPVGDINKNGKVDATDRSQYQANYQTAGWCTAQLALAGVTQCCGDNQITASLGEKCDPPSAACTTWTSECNDQHKHGTRINGDGTCNDKCNLCTAANPITGWTCIKGQCGATAASAADCPGRTYNDNICMCEGGVGTEDVASTGVCTETIPLADTVAIWHLNGTARDSTGKNNGVIVGANCGVAGKIGTACSFNTNQYISVANSASLTLRQDFTIMLWFKPNTAINGNYAPEMFSKGHDFDHDAYHFSFHGQYGIDGAGNLFFTGRKGNGGGGSIGGYTTTAYWPAGQWHHAAVTFQRTATDGIVSIYVDGALNSRTAPGYDPGYLMTSADPLIIGGGQEVSMPFFDGIIDEVRIYSKVLTEAQINTIYTNENNGCIPACQNDDDLGYTCMNATHQQFKWANCTIKPQLCTLNCSNGQCNQCLPGIHCLNSTHLATFAGDCTSTNPTSCTYGCNQTPANNRSCNAAPPAPPCGDGLLDTLTETCDKNKNCISDIDGVLGCKTACREPYPNNGRYLVCTNDCTLYNDTIPRCLADCTSDPAGSTAAWGAANKAVGASCPNDGIINSNCECILRPMDINLIYPVRGVSTEHNIKPIFETGSDATCKYGWNSAQLNLPIQTSNYRQHTTAVAITLTDTPRTIFVNCSKLASTYFRVVNFSLSFDNTTPVIDPATLGFNPQIVTYVSPSGNFESNLTAVTDDRTICRLSYENTTFDNMFPFTGENIANYTITHTTTIEVTDDETEYTYYVRCSNLVELVSNALSASFTVNSSIKPELQITSPAAGSFQPSRSIELSAHTLKEAYCKFGTDANSITKTRGSFGQFTKDHSTTTEPFAADGSATLYVRCEAYPASGVQVTNANTTFIIDSTPPTKPTVDDSSSLDQVDAQHTWQRDRLKAKWHSEDNVSGIDSYQYAIFINGSNEIFKDWSSPTTSEEITVYDLNLTNATTYYFKVRSKNKAGLFSLNGTSDGIAIDTSLKPPVPVSCLNQVKDSNESDIDCGAVCDKCANGKNCYTNTDCTGGFCNATKKCASPSCSDRAKNGDETGTDCGGSCTAKCSAGSGCTSNSECTSGKCNAGLCEATDHCNNAVWDRSLETDLDCGNKCAEKGYKCDTGSSCAVNSDCKSGLCTASKCAVDTDGDGVADSQDTCDRTARGATVDANGCSEEQLNSIDSDSDGLPDWWEYKYGLNPHDPADADLDADNDGLTNLQEYSYLTKGIILNPNLSDNPESAPSNPNYLTIGLLVMLLILLIIIIVILAAKRPAPKPPEQPVFRPMPVQPQPARPAPVMRRPLNNNLAERESLMQAFGQPEAPKAQKPNISPKEADSLSGLTEEDLAKIQERTQSLQKVIVEEDAMREDLKKKMKASDKKKGKKK